MFKKLFHLLPGIGKMVHAPGMPVCSEDDPMPEVDFNSCEPNVMLSEIKRVFFAKMAAEPFDDWFNPDSWNARLSETSTDVNAIRPLSCIADKPAPTVIRKRLSGDRYKITHKTHVINVTIDEVSAANHAFIMSLKKGKKYRVWYETAGGLMFGSNAGIAATVFGDMVLQRGQGEIMVYQLEIYWESLQTETWINSPIFEDTGGTIVTPPLETTMLLYPDMVAQPIGGIAPNVSGYWHMKFQSGGAFVNIYPLTVPWPVPTNEVESATEEEQFGGGLVLPMSMEPSSQTLKIAEYKITYRATIHSMLVYTAALEKTVLFEDIMGNQAWSSALVLLHKNSNTIDDYGIAQCVAEQVYSTGLVATVRLTRTHPAMSSPHISSVSLIWDFPGGVIATRPDPADPANPDKILVDLVPGTHTIGIRALYDSAFWAVHFPQSSLYFVIKVT